jgi:uncharacterized membrane protein YccC
MKSKPKSRRKRPKKNLFLLHNLKVSRSYLSAYRNLILADLDFQKLFQMQVRERLKLKSISFDFLQKNRRRSKISLQNLLHHPEEYLRLL